MAGPPVTDIDEARRRRSKNDPNARLAEFALTQCEQAMLERDWDRFDRWFRIHQRVRPRSASPASSPVPLRMDGAKSLPAVSAMAGHRVGAEATRRWAKIAAAALVLAVVAPLPTRTITHSTSTEGTVIASTTLPDLTDRSLYVAVVGGRVPPDGTSLTSTSDEFFFQLAGATELALDGFSGVIGAGQAVFVPQGARVTLKPEPHQTSRYLRFMLTAAKGLETADVSAPDARVIYRTGAPIHGIWPGKYVLDLIKVTLPQRALPDPPHHRSGAALHMVLSGFGAETADGATVARSPGSVSFEPGSLLYQWSNPGSQPLTYLVFNFNPAGEDAVLAAR
jgi:mannose-6-phosphate isomerase-like protein (cupin superfamily)